MQKRSYLEDDTYICLIDFRLTGHHPVYLANFAQKFQELGCKVTIFTSDSNNCLDSLVNALPQLRISELKFVETSATTVNKSRRLGCRAYFNLIKLQKEIESTERIFGQEFSFIFFAYLDDIAHIDLKLPYLIKTPFTRKFSGLLMAPRERVLRKISFPLNFLLTSTLEHLSDHYSEIGLLVEDVQHQVEKRLNTRTTVYPDFCSNAPAQKTESPVIEKVQSRIRNRITTSLLGSILPHKCVDLFIDCVNAANPDKHFFVIAGKFKKSAFAPEQWHKIQGIMDKPPENLLIFNEWLESEAIFDTLVQMSDYLFAYYRNFQKSSNVLSKGAFYKKPVIVSNKFLMGDRVQKYKLGYALSEKATVELFANNSWSSFQFDQRLREQYVELHSVKRLMDIFSNLLIEQDNALISTD